MAESLLDSITSVFRSATSDTIIERLDRDVPVAKKPMPASPAPSSGGKGSSDSDLAELARLEAAAERAKRSKALRRSQGPVVLPSPGKLDDINRESQDTLNLNTHDGVRFEYHKPVVGARDKNFTYSHMFWLGPSHLQGGASYEFSTQLSFAKCMLMSQIDTNGMLNGRYHQQWTDKLMTKLQFAIGPQNKRQFDMSVLEVDYNGSDYSANLKVSHDSLVVGSFLQSLTPTLSAGIECLVQPAEYAAHSRYVGRYDNKSDIVNVSILDSGTVNLSYARVLSPRLTLASDFKFDPNNRESAAKFGYKYTLRQSQIRGAVDSNGVVSAVLEENISQMLRFNINGEIDHASNSYKFGFGASIG